MDKVFKAFVDFDGTITKSDVGEAMFRKFGNIEKVNGIIEKLLNDEISAKECWLSLCGSVENLDKKSLDDFIGTMEIDETFHEFVDYCERYGIELYVLSDGFDYYIRKIFERENLQNLKVYSNKMVITRDNKIIPEFPYLDSNFKTSANCKRNHIINHSSDDEFTVFIGDGNSDKETARICDFIFAKDGLLRHCEMERITFFPFEDFRDVIERMDKLRSKKRLKKRYQAELKRKELYIRE
jgi:2,3-diketo-5-methylthio-1-phosphopentane phosphatase